jgi:hypothetical protein
VALCPVDREAGAVLNGVIIGAFGVLADPPEVGAGSKKVGFGAPRLPPLTPLRGRQLGWRAEQAERHGPNSLVTRRRLTWTEAGGPVGTTKQAVMTTGKLAMKIDGAVLRGGANVARVTNRFRRSDGAESRHNRLK